MLLPGSIQMISILLITATLDDPHGQMLSTGVSKQLQSPLLSAPAHQFFRSKSDGLAKNTRVQLLEIDQPSLRVQTLGHEAKSATLPRTRICFTFGCPFNNHVR
jgi:hypothetical protein